MLALSLVDEIVFSGGGVARLGLTLALFRAQENVLPKTTGRSVGLTSSGPSGKARGPPPADWNKEPGCPSNFPKNGVGKSLSSDSPEEKSTENPTLQALVREAGYTAKWVLFCGRKPPVQP
jgi:hypothetical protein